MPPATKSPPEVMTTRETAAYLRFSEITVRRLVRTAGLPCVEVNRAMRFFKPEVDKWLVKKSVN